MGIDEVGIDKVGIDEVGIDKVGIDEVGRYLCDSLNENCMPLPSNVEFELEIILSVQVIFQLN